MLHLPTRPPCRGVPGLRGVWVCSCGVTAVTAGDGHRTLWGESPQSNSGDFPRSLPFPYAVCLEIPPMQLLALAPVTVLRLQLQRSKELAAGAGRRRQLHLGHHRAKMANSESKPIQPALTPRRWEIRTQEPFTVRTPVGGPLSAGGGGALADGDTFLPEHSGAPIVVSSVTEQHVSRCIAHRWLAVSLKAIMTFLLQCRFARLALLRIIMRQLCLFGNVPSSQLFC